ncbi:MAG: D-aminopeptidase [Firmicutes bacterium]|nr:D-aminopeptidase [Bacillota bacterium]
MRVFICVDMEGISGVTTFEETMAGKADYEYFRRQMHKETNAAIKGALQAGATRIVVRDGHDSACNLLPEELCVEAELIRNWSGGLYGMMEGLDDTFDAVVFVGHHAKANTPHGVLKHTMSMKINDLRVNGLSLPEIGWNALIAGYHGVPVVFVSGDHAVCEQAQALFENVVTVPVKEGRGLAALHRHPEKLRMFIEDGVKKALLERSGCKPFVLGDEYTVEIEFNSEPPAYRGEWYPGAVRTGNCTLQYSSLDFMDCLRFFEFVT